MNDLRLKSNLVLAWSTSWVLRKVKLKGSVFLHHPKNQITVRRPLVRRIATMTDNKVTFDMLNVDERGVALGAIKVTQALFSSHKRFTKDNNDEQELEDEHTAMLSTGDLLAFCSLKGVAIQGNVWDRPWLLQKAREYVAWERAARLKADDDTWDLFTDNRKVRLLHHVCNGEGDATYVDPRTGYTVFSAFAHLKRGHCCGVRRTSENENGNDNSQFERTHRCRHCPYAHDGSLTASSAVALMQRLQVIRFVRANRTVNWRQLADGIKPFSIGGDLSEMEDEFDTVQDKTNPHDMTMTYTLDEVVGSSENKQRLRRKLVKPRLNGFVKKPPSNKTVQEQACQTCGGERVMTCRRCNGWTAVFSPRVQKCEQCNGEGMHSCISCTPFRPPPLTSIYS